MMVYNGAYVRIKDGDGRDYIVWSHKGTYSHLMESFNGIGPRHECSMHDDTLKVCLPTGKPFPYRVRWS